MTPTNFEEFWELYIINSSKYDSDIMSSPVFKIVAQESWDAALDAGIAVIRQELGNCKHDD